MLEPLLGRLAAGGDLSLEETAQAIDAIMQGQVAEGEIGLLLTGLAMKGETVDEVAGAAAAMRRHMTRIRSSRGGLIDTCGTGGDASGTFNISTAAALVAAAAGVPVAKHGNRRVTSRSGSADVLATLGVNIEASVETVERCLDELGICFCFAPLMHPSMKNVAAVRRKLEFPTIFNLLGPLSNPAEAPFQLLGTRNERFRRLLAEALARLGVRRAAVVCGEDGLDEVTLGGRTDVTLVEGNRTRELQWTPDDFGLPRSGPESLQAAGAEESAALIRAVLAGQPGPPRDIVVLNSAAALWVAGAEADLKACAARAAAAIDSGAARSLLERLAAVSHSP